MYMCSDSKVAFDIQKVILVAQNRLKSYVNFSLTILLQLNVTTTWQLDYSLNTDDIVAQCCVKNKLSGMLITVV